MLDSSIHMMKTGQPFSDFDFHEHLQSILGDLDFNNCTPIQERAMPLVLNGQDVAGLAQTGTGKTAAFLLPLIERVLRSESETDNEEHSKRAFDSWQHTHFNLVLVPTRELAEQVKECAMDFLKGTDHRVVVVLGGMPIDKQIKQLEKGFTFLVATPGRLIDLYKEHKVDLKQVRAVVFDEADRMFDMGFKDDMKYILRRIPDQRQLLLFSATLNLDVFNVAYQFGANPVEIKVSQDKTTAENVEDKIFHLGRDEKPSHLLGLLDKLKPRQVIIFTNFKSNVERIAEFLNKNNHKALGISSLLTQAQRKRVMTRFRDDSGENILVATDVAARGLDIEGVDLVINYELPDDAENYVHRIGRTGRAGEKGKAFSFVSDKDVESLDRIKKYLRREVETEWLEDNELPTDFTEFPRGELLMRKPRNKKPQDSRGRRDGRRDNKRGDSRSKGKKSDTHKTDTRKTEGKGSSKKKRPDKKRERDEDQKQVHRDKRSGRHRSQVTASKDPNKKRKQRPKSTAKKTSSQKSRNYKIGNIQKKAGLVDKVKSAFKGIFG